VNKEMIWLACLVFAALLLGGCAAGPQTQAAAPVVSVSCGWHIHGDHNMVEDNDCLVDRSSSEAESRAVGNQIETGDIAPSVSVTP
jgi:hypothetical protein